jgi:hypothetical protein
VRPTPKITPRFVVAIVEQARIEAAQEAAFRIPTGMAMAVVLAGLIGIGWMVRSTWAQDDAKAPAQVVSPRPSRGEEQVPESPVPNLAVFPPHAESPSGFLPTDLPPPPTELVPSGQPAVAGDNEDPEKTVQAFVAQNRKVAEGQLKNLKGEAERLRARLKKVEAGIRRWESLVEALDQSEAAAKDLAGPSNLEPVPAARRQFRPKAVASQPANPPATTVEGDLAPGHLGRPDPGLPQAPR